MRLISKRMSRNSIYLLLQYFINVQSISRKHISRNYRPVIYKCTINKLHIVAHVSGHIYGLKIFCATANCASTACGEFPSPRRRGTTMCGTFSLQCRREKGFRSARVSVCTDPSLLSCAGRAVNNRVPCVRR